jgi:hypothetical protein
MEGKLNDTGDHDEATLELLPLDYLVSVMHDPDAAPRDRIKAARAAAPYLHARPEMDDMPIVIEDPFGFPVGSVLAKEIREDQDPTMKKPKTIEEAIDLYNALGKPNVQRSGYQKPDAKFEKRLKEISCPASYGGNDAAKDEARISYLSSKSSASKDPLTADEAAERHHLQFHVSVYRASQGCEHAQGRALTIEEAIELYATSAPGANKDPGAPANTNSPASERAR